MTKLFLRSAFLIFLTLSWHCAFSNTIEKGTDSCVETGEFLLAYNPQWAIKHLEICPETPQKYDLLIKAYFQIGDYEKRRSSWVKYHELTKGAGSFTTWMLALIDSGKATSQTSSWEISAVVYYRDMISRWPNNPYTHYFFALYTLKDPVMFNGREVPSNLLVEYNSLFKQKETICSLARKSLEKAFNFDKAKVLKVPESFTKQCGKW